MRLFLDAFTGTQIVSDSYKFIYKFEDAIVEIKARFVNKKEEDVDVGCGNAFGGGG